MAHINMQSGLWKPSALTEKIDPQHMFIDNQDVLNAFILQTDQDIEALQNSRGDDITSSANVTYTDGRPTQTTLYWEGGSVKKEQCDITYGGGDVITSIITRKYNTSGVLLYTITDTITYTNGIPTSIGRVAS